MMRFKREVIRRAERVIFLMEAQKFSIPQKLLIQPFDRKWKS